MSENSYEVDLQNYGEWSVKVHKGSGTFTATRDDISLTDKNLESLKSTIDKLTREKPEVLAKPTVNLRVIGMIKRKNSSGSSNVGTLYATTLTGLNRQNREFQLDIPKGMELTNVLADTPDNREWLKGFIDHLNIGNVYITQFRERQISGNYGYGRIELNDYPVALRRLTAEWEKSKQAGTPKPAEPATEQAS